jgi:hypothetical protein
MEGTMRLIDADAFAERHCEGCSKDVREICKDDPVCASLMWIVDEPSVDAVPVVRCKDCQYYEEAKVNELGFLICRASGMEITDMDFCSYGERREP